MNAKDYKPLCKAMSKSPACNTIEQYPHPPNESVPIEDLRIFPGYQCQHCDNSLTQSEAVAQNHIYTNHKHVHTSSHSGYQSVYLQTWSVNNWKGYWTVIDPKSQSSTAREEGSDSAGMLTWEE